MRYITLGDTIEFPIPVNSTAANGTDPSSCTWSTRKEGASSSAAPVQAAQAATLLTHASYPDGALVAIIAATSGNGYAADSVYHVFCTASVSSVNPTGYIGSFDTHGPRASQASVDDVEGKVDDLETRLTAQRATNLDNLDATVSSRASQTSVDDLPTNAEFTAALAAADDAVLAAIATLVVQVGDLPTNSELATALAAADDAILAALAAGVPVSSLAAVVQQIRDSMKLAPTAGAPAAGSVDKHLDDIEAGGGGGGGPIDGEYDFETDMGTKRVTITSV